MIAILGVLAGVVLPGWLLARRVVLRADLVEQVVYGVGFGLVVIPTVCFTLMWAFSVPITAVSVYSVAGAVALLSMPWRHAESGAKGRSEWISLAALALTAAVLLPFTEVRATDSLEFFEPCLHQCALYMHQPDGAGWTLHGVTHVFAHPTEPGYGLRVILDYQRPTNGAVFAAVASVAGGSVVELLTLLVFFVIAGGASLVARRVTDDRRIALVAGIATLIAVHGVIAYMVNETTFGLAAGLLMLALLVRAPSNNAGLFAAGVLLGFAFGVRLTVVLWLLPLMLLRPRRWMWAGAAISLAPWLWTYWSLTGDLLFHPTPPGSVVEHTFFGLTFDFRPLNWPFFDHLVRYEEHLLPPMASVPLACLRSAGALLAAGVLVGVFALWRRARKLALATVLWVAPLTGFLLVQGYIDYEKTSWILMAAPPIPLLLAAAMEHRTRRMAVAWAAVATALVFVGIGLANTGAPADPRQYRLVNPDIEVTPEPKAVREAALRTPAILPALQRVEHPSQLWARLTRPAADDFVSGQIVAWQAHVEPLKLEFAVVPVDEEPALPPILDVKPFDRAEVHEGTFVVALKLETSRLPTVQLTEHEHRFDIRIDPGPKPHKPGYVMFVVKDYKSEDFAGLTVRLLGRPLPVRLGGYHITTDGDEPGLDLKIATNYPAIEPPPLTQTVQFAFETRRYDWWWRD